ncbi:hypothetical protein EFS45_11235 [Lactobacillus crispatus]|nr:hypothetical protein [Lactobacillus crispatus]
MFKEINLRNHSSLHKLFYSLITPPAAELIKNKQILSIKSFLGAFEFKLCSINSISLLSISLLAISSLLKNLGSYAIFILFVSTI